MWLMLFASPAIWIAGEIVSFAHWTTDIALSARAVRNRWLLFVGVAMILGLSGFLWTTVAGDPCLCESVTACTALWSIPALLRLTLRARLLPFSHEPVGVVERGPRLASRGMT
jgi:hypothetical protein